MKVIDKEALVAKIEKLFEKVGNSLGEYRNGAEHTLISIKDFLDTLEVKEVDANDAFIKKAEDYLNSQLYDWVSITNPDQRSCANVILKKDFIKDFINYMKGE